MPNIDLSVCGEYFEVYDWVEGELLPNCLSTNFLVDGRFRLSSDYPGMELKAVSSPIANPTITKIFINCPGAPDGETFHIVLVDGYESQSVSHVHFNGGYAEVLYDPPIPFSAIDYIDFHVYYISSPVDIYAVEEVVVDCFWTLKVRTVEPGCTPETVPTCGGWVSIADIFDIACDDPGFHIDESGNVYTTVGSGEFTLTEKTGITYPDPSTTVSLRLVWVSGDYPNAESGLDVRSRDAIDLDHWISFYSSTEDSGLLSSLYTSLYFHYAYGWPSESLPDVWRIEIFSDPFCSE